MSTNQQEPLEETDDTSPKTFAGRGVLVGTGFGLLAAWRIVSRAFDSNVTDHSPLFSSAVLIVCLFAILVLVFFSLVGLVVGAMMRRKPASESKS